MGNLHLRFDEGRGACFGPLLLYRLGLERIQSRDRQGAVSALDFPRSGPCVVLTAQDRSLPVAALTAA